MTAIYIETPRLIIRELLLVDDHGMFAMDSDPEVHRYINHSPVSAIEESRAVIHFVRQQYIDQGIGRWAMILKDTGEFIGWTGFKLMQEQVNGHVNFYDFGYRLMRRHWHQGFATEGAKASLDFGIEVLRLKDIYAMTDVDNGASRHILESLSFRLIEVFPYDAQPSWRLAGQPTTWYKLIDARIE